MQATNALRNLTTDRSKALAEKSKSFLIFFTALQFMKLKMSAAEVCTIQIQIFISTEKRESNSKRLNSFHSTLEVFL